MDFTILSKSDAEAYLQQFLDENDARLDRLMTRWLRSGCPPEALDYSPESLGPLWAWALTHVTPRAADDPGADLPSWVSEHRQFRQLSDDSLRLIDDVARYLGEVVRRTVPDASWSVARARAKGYVDQNWPALTVGTTYLNPVLLVLNAALSALHQLPTNGPDRLRQVYDANTRLAR